MKKVIAIGLQQTFLQMVHEQLRKLTRDQVEIQTISLNEITEVTLNDPSVILYFSKGLKTIFEKIFPISHDYFYIKRESFIYNMGELFSIRGMRRILVVNDMKYNTDEMTMDLKRLELGHDFFPYYPDETIPENIEFVITAGEQPLVPASLGGIPVIDIGSRVISLESVMALFEKIGMNDPPSDIARHYMRTMMALSQKWQVLGKGRHERPEWFGIRQDTSAPVTFSTLIQNSTAMKTFCLLAKKLAPTETPIHIQGRIGTGKAAIAQAIHNESGFSNGPFVSINCAARTPTNLERELFGWEDGSTIYSGLFESAKNGTLCIEDIGKLPGNLQAGLLQALTEKRIVRSNGTGSIPVNVRLITTSGQALESLSPDALSPELMLWITRCVCHVPPLLERMEDFEELISQYVVSQLKRPEVKISQNTIDALKAYDWKGDIQELYYVLQHAMSISGPVLSKKNLPYYIAKTPNPQPVVSQNKKTGSNNNENDFHSINQDMTQHGFIEECKKILEIYKTGKSKSIAYGRTTVQDKLKKSALVISKQQLRLKLERMNTHGLLIVRPGRGGTTISQKGEQYLSWLENKIP